MEACLSEKYNMEKGQHTEQESRKGVLTNEEIDNFFQGKNLEDVCKLFKKADTDGSGGLDIDEFYDVMKEICPQITMEDVELLHMKIDTNCDGTVDLNELLDYSLKKDEKTKDIPYKICEYATVTSNGIMTLWSNNFEPLQNVPIYDKGKDRIPYSQIPKIQGRKFYPETESFSSLLEHKCDCHDTLTVSVFNDICKQVSYMPDLKSVINSPITSALYNVYNNELYVANTIIGKRFGRGTSRIIGETSRPVIYEAPVGTKKYHMSMTSHRQPLCSMLYHTKYQQVISVCQKGQLKVWDIYNGRALMNFNISPEDKEKKLISCFISFNETQRKLITVINRTVKQWNFNSGELLDVLKAFPGDITKKDTILVTGDSKGVVCLYDIQKFGLQTTVEDEKFETMNGQKFPLQSPPLLASWVAGLSELVSVACDPAGKKIITAELNYNVKLWTNTGTLVGLFGKDQWENMTPLETS
ncbi:uncharacterized protein LOC119796051, partial [Cyprinodon tularosa]|uniref:uncharacterized protein LOC119796051 n=1 Tax=Cyprinodon tularosa TaxID=77115 RepID=UPI0018E23D21